MLIEQRKAELATLANPKCKDCYGRGYITRYLDPKTKEIDICYCTVFKTPYRKDLHEEK